MPDRLTDERLEQLLRDATPGPGGESPIWGNDVRAIVAELLKLRKQLFHIEQAEMGRESPLTWALLREENKRLREVAYSTPPDESWEGGTTWKEEFDRMEVKNGRLRHLDSIECDELRKENKALREEREGTLERLEEFLDCDKSKAQLRTEVEQSCAIEVQLHEENERLKKGYRLYNHEPCPVCGEVAHQRGGLDD
jgi:DNA repair exonuclease SbcCD ATPase subunit